MQEDPPLELTFVASPVNVSVAQFAAMSVAREHAPSLAVVEDLRLALDEVLFSLSSPERTRVHLRVEAAPGRVALHVEVTGTVRELDTVIRSLVDELTVDRADGDTTIDVVRTW